MPHTVIKTEPTDPASNMAYVTVLLGILVHTIYLYSVFDIYFTSPLVHGMTPHHSAHKPPAKRLVLFIADGLRADKLFENSCSRAPFVRNVILKSGRWGVSHTRVPTESRPGHVAIIAGFYEDVSAVAKGWKENPVEFDSVFNESRHTWSWGSPDILPMFSKGASGNHVSTDMYDAQQEDFAAKDNSKLDTWVFEKVQSFLENANDSIHEKLRTGQNVFFLHLLGIDTNGHAHRPMSKEYLANIQSVDQGIKRMYELFEEHFNHDNSTAYIMTSDHGMTNWGSHGAGHPHETLTPLVAWGAGLQKPGMVESNDYNDGLSEQWGLARVKRCDVSQADIAPLMSSLIGVSFPLNSVGILPLEYLDNTDVYKTENIFTNARQILAQYQVKEKMKKETSLIFRQFPELTGSKQMAFIRDITISMKSGDYDKAIKLCHDLMKLSLKGLNYYQKYDRVLLSCIVTLGFLGWISCVVLRIFRETSKNCQKNNKWNSFINKIFFGLGGVAVVLLQIEKAPVTHYLYCLLPLLCWNYVVQQWATIRILCVTAQNNVPRLVLSVLTVTLGLEVLVLSFFHRYILSVGLFLLATWPLATPLVKTHAVTVGLWFIHCLTLALFPLLPVVGRESNYSLVTLAGILSFIEALVVLYLYKKSKGCFTMTKVVLVLQFLILLSAIAILNLSAYNLSVKRGVPKANHIFSWSTIIFCVVLPTLVTDGLALRLLSTTTSLMSVYLLLSTSYEALFFLVLSSTMALWLTLEHQLSSSSQYYPNTSLAQIPVHDPRNGHARQASSVQDTRDSTMTDARESKERQVSFDDLRCSFFFVYFIITAFFGTGNIASINTFDPATVYCFLTIFSPFIMGALLILKILIPFVVVTCVFDAVHVVCRVPVNRLFLLVLIMTDFVALQFFFLVQDYGSWLEIGTSISHFVIMLSFIIYLFFIFGVARYFTRNTWWNSVKAHIQ